MITSRISGILPQRAFERVLHRIGEIITVELANQHQIGTIDYSPDVYKERVIGYDATELSVVNVTMSAANYDSFSVADKNGTVRYNIACYVSEKDNEGALVMGKAQRLIGIIDSIFQQPVWRTLGFDTPFIQHVRGNSINIQQPNNEDSVLTASAVLELEVKMPETPLYDEGVLFGENHTTATLGTTDKGFIYILNA